MTQKSETIMLPNAMKLWQLDFVHGGEKEEKLAST